MARRAASSAFPPHEFQVSEPDKNVASDVVTRFAVVAPQSPDVISSRSCHQSTEELELSTNELPHPTRFIEAAGYGLRVFPGQPRGKKPIGPWKAYQENTSATADQLAAWDASDFNLCIVTGSASGILVVDVDSPEAQKLIDELDPPLTPAVRTAKGQHLYFRFPDYEIRNSTNIRGVKLDVRGEGGYVIGAGSIHPTGLRYDWTISPADVEFAPLPDNLRALLEKESRSGQRADLGPATDLPSTGVRGLDRCLGEELAEAESKVSSAPQGERNDMLFKMAARMAAHVSAASVDWLPCAEALAASATAAGLEDREIAPTLESAWKAGSSEPTAWIRVAVEWIYLANQDLFYHLRSGTYLKPNGFHGQFGYLYWDKGSFAHYLLRADRVKRVHDIAYEPLNSDRYFERDGREFLNTFKPSKVEPTPGDPSPFLDFMAGLIPDEAEREHLLEMIAFSVRNPGRRLRYALMLRTPVQGVGKSMLLEIWGELLGSHNVRKTSPKELASDFQGYLPQRLLVLCEELNLGMGARAYNDLKDMITSDLVTVNEKYLRQREWRVFANFVFLTNLERPLLIEPTDRRLFYINSSAQRREASYYTEFVAWWRNNLGVIRHFLDGIDLDDFNPYECPPMTEAKRQLIADSRSELAQELALAIEERRGCFSSDIVTLDQVRIELARLLQIKGSNQLMNALKEVGALPLGQHRVVGSVDRQSLWAVRNVEYWNLTDRANRAEEMNRKPGLFADLDGTGIEVVHSSRYPGDYEASFG